MHVLTVRSILADNGPGSQSFTIAQELRGRGHSVSFASSGGAYVPTIREGGFAVHVIPQLAHDQHTPLAIAVAIRKLAGIIRAEKPEIIHGHNAAATMCAFIAGLSVGRRIPCVTSVRGVEERASYSWRNGIWKRLPGYLLGVCMKTKERLLGFGVPEDKIVVTYNGADTSRFDPSRMESEVTRRELGLEGKIVVGTTGAMVGPDFLDGPSKGQHKLIEAVGRLKDKHPNLHVLLVGDGPRRKEAESAADAAGIRDRVVFAGKRFDVPEMLSAMDIYCLPSIWGEFFPNSIIEAMCMGKPWIGSRIAGLPELTADGSAGWLVEPGDVDGLVEKLDTLASDQSLRNLMGEAGRAEALERFTIDKVTDRILGAYRKAGAPV